MNVWEKKIIDAFTRRYFASAAEAGKEGRNTLRLRSVSIFPGFDTAPADEKESYLEAAETLERKSLVTLNWEKRGRGERLKTLNCIDIRRLFEESGRRDPKDEAEEIRGVFKAEAPALGDSFLNYLSEHFGLSETVPAGNGGGIDRRAAEDLVCLLKAVRNSAKTEHISTRALSVSLYGDSKRLEHLLNIFNPILSRVQKQGISTPALSFLERSYPEIWIAGKIIIEYEAGENNSPPLVNANALILGFPLQSVRAIRNIRAVESKDKPRVLTIENKETFYALANSQNSGQGDYFRWDSLLYIGGYLNQAAAAMIRILAASGFCFYHSGDLDPDGILILQNIRDIAQKPVVPVWMDAASFDRYLPWSRPLPKTVLLQIKKIREDTRAIPGIADLIRRIEETGRGVEQEIIDWEDGG
jgi:hypothetical protein